jgi:hypothetical protein
MVTLRENIKAIIEELKDIQTKPKPYREADDEFPLPRMIATPNGGSIIVSRKIDKTIAAVANQLMSSDQRLARTFTRVEWQALVRRTFGPALANIDLDADSAHNVGQVFSEITAAVKEQIPDRASREYAFGCTLFGNVIVKPFLIGPAHFESRLAWLARKHNEGNVSAVTRRRVEQVWLGRRLQKRKLSYDSMAESDILEAIHSGPFVCSVSTSGLAAEAGSEKSLTAARLAMAAIALLWRNSSQVLTGMNLIFDRRLHSQMALTFIPGKVVLAGSRLSHMPHGLWMKDGVWENVFADYSDHFQVAGEILGYILDPSGAVARPKMMNTLSQALLWFHEGCREGVAVMAIVKYSAVLDALACGGKAEGIRKLINARLGIQDNKAIRPNGPMLQRAIDDIYSDGRSRTIHGTNNKLSHDWTEIRGLAEQFARLCLSACFEWAAKNPSSDSPENLSR